jgi:hypothetical protein
MDRYANARLSFPKKRAFHRWSGWPNGYRTFWLDPKGWGTEKMLAFEGQFSPKPEAPQASV